MNKLLLTGLLASFISNNAVAEKLLKAQESIEVNAKASAVWEKIGDFGDIAAWHPAIESTEIVDGENNQRGAIRVLTLQDGSMIKEKLESYYPGKQKYIYSMVEGDLPVSGYQSYLTVRPITGNMSRVTWYGRFKSAGASDDEAVNTISGVYRDGLDNLKRIAEAE